MQQFSQDQNQNQFSNPQVNNNQQNNQGYYSQQGNFDNQPNLNYGYQNPQPVVNNQLPRQTTIAKPTKSKTSIFNVRNILIGLLLTYSIFSFCWIAILYAGVDGSKVCIEDNIVCQINVPYTKQAVKVVNENIETKQELVKQKNAKNFIKDIWQNQTILNDNLIARQQVVEKSIGSYRDYIQNYIRFINDKPEILKGFSKDDFENKKIEVADQIANLKLLQDNNYQNKISNQKQINQIYQDLGERQDNSFVEQR